ncbi:hypothetical protein BN903_28 [Halorubrum sp. AJ67]|nr:hypothetical protein BN903_28 [Halorubrum sp. AJ67]
MRHSIGAVPRLACGAKTRTRGGPASDRRERVGPREEMTEGTK